MMKRCGLPWLLGIASIVVVSLQLAACSPKAAPGGGIWFSQDRRSAGSFVDDQAITIKANLALARDKQLWKNSHISTLSYNNTLLVVGQTRNPQLKRQVNTLLQTIPEIREIYNEISIDDPLPLGLRARDTWTTAQVKGRLFGNRDIGMNRVKVITENGIVYLMGLLTEDEADIAIEVARNVQGVREVITVLERVTDAAG